MRRCFAHACVWVCQLWGNYSSIVWSTTAEHAKELAQLPADEFVDRLNHELTAAPPQADVPAFLQPLHQAAASVTRALGNAPASPGFRGAPHVVNVRHDRLCHVADVLGSWSGLMLARWLVAARSGRGSARLLSAQVLAHQHVSV